MFEKEKGGVGSTGSLVTAARSIALRGGEVTFIEASLTQRDVMNAYGGHHRVHAIDLKDVDARDRILKVVVGSPPGGHVLVNVPGGRVDELDRVHELLHFLVEDNAAPIDLSLTWTMGLDAASRSTLDAVLETSPPGRFLLNLPAWGGGYDAYTTVEDELVDRVEGRGGAVFQMPALDLHLYDLFRTRQIALDRIVYAPGTSFGNKLSLRMWEREIVRALAGLY